MSSNQHRTDQAAPDGRHHHEDGQHLDLAGALAQAERTIAQLQHALDSRVIIEQAKGFIAASYGVSTVQAFILMRRHANRHHVTIHDVSHAIVNLGLRPVRD